MHLDSNTEAVQDLLLLVMQTETLHIQIMAEQLGVLTTAFQHLDYDAMHLVQVSMLQLIAELLMQHIQNNGIVWTSSNSSRSTSANASIVWGNGKFVALGGTNGIMYSLDGITW